jgi:uncharacterized membrane protein
LVDRIINEREEPVESDPASAHRVLRKEAEEGMISLGITHVLGSVAGLVGVAWIGEGVIKEMGYARTAILWSVVVYIGGSVVVLKWVWDKIEDAISTFGLTL